MLWLGAKDKDFTTPPSEEEITTTVGEWRRKHPPLPPRTRPVDAQPETPVEEQKEDLPPPVPAIPHGDLEISPALDHYIEHAKLGAPSYIQLAKQLEEQQQPGFALLAWERVLDASRPTSEQHTQASLAILRLRQEAPVWNADPDNNIDIVLHLSVPESLKAEISGLVGQITGDIRSASSYQIAPQLLLTTAEQRPGFPPPPMTIWLSGTGDNAPETPKLTTAIAPAIGQDQQLTLPVLESKVYSALYRTLLGSLKQQSQLTPPAPLASTTPARQALTSHLTRLHWHKLAHTLNADPKPKANKPTTEEDQEEQ